MKKSGYDDVSFWDLLPGIFIWIPFTLFFLGLLLSLMGIDIF